MCRLAVSVLGAEAVESEQSMKLGQDANPLNRRIPAEVVTRRRSAIGRYEATFVTRLSDRGTPCPTRPAPKGPKVDEKPQDEAPSLRPAVSTTWRR